MKVVVRILILALAVVAGGAGAAEIVNADGSSNGIVVNTSGLPYITINQPGSYKLTKNLVKWSTGVSGVLVSITANNVTLDLGGFMLGGYTTCTPNSDGHGGGYGTTCTTLTGFAGISVSGRNDTIRNGTISGNYWHGIIVGSPGGDGVELRDLAVEGNNGMGIVSGAPSSHLVNVRASYNAGFGISIDTGALLENVRADFNGGDGVNGTGTFLNVSASNNAGSGIVNYGASIVGAQAYGNHVIGISMAGGLLQNARSIGNAGYGVYGNQAIVEETTSLSNGSSQFYLVSSCYSHLVYSSATDLVGGTSLGAGANCHL